MSWLYIAESCAGLSNPANGNVVVDGLIVDSTATYDCDPGYYLAGNKSRTCEAGMSSGVWSGQEPMCIRTYVYNTNQDLTISHLFRTM